MTKAVDVQSGSRLVSPEDSHLPGPGVVLTREQILSAPNDVKNWLKHTLFNEEASQEDFILEQNGVISGDGELAICNALEIKNILIKLNLNYLALQIFFQLGCNYWNPTTGERHAYPLKLSDFRRHTDVDNTMQLRRGIHYINEALRELRGDSEATVCQIDAHGHYRVHCITQQRIYRFWLCLSTLATKRKLVPFPSRLARSLDGRQNDEI